MIVSADKFPNILKAFHAIEDDNNPHPICFPLYDVPTAYDTHLAGIEREMAKLSRTERAPESPPLPAHVKPDAWMDSEFYTFVNGEQQEVLDISNRNMDLTIASQLLNDFFEGFEFIEEDPYQRALKARIEYFDSMDDKASADALRSELV